MRITAIVMILMGLLLIGVGMSIAPRWFVVLFSGAWLLATGLWIEKDLMGAMNNTNQGDQ